MVPFAGLLAGEHRIANDAFNRFELFRGQDASPDLDAAPIETFTSLPHVTAALPLPPSGTRKFLFVTQLRNIHNLRSLNTIEVLIEVDAAGALVAIRPSAPEGTRADTVAAGKIRIQSFYDYTADGNNQANQWLVFLRSDGTDPDPDIDTPTVVTMAKNDGIAKLDFLSVAFVGGTTVKAIVRTRRTAAPAADSDNLNIVTAIASTTGPAAPEPAGAFFGTVLKQD